MLGGQSGGGKQLEVRDEAARLTRCKGFKTLSSESGCACPPCRRARLIS